MNVSAGDDVFHQFNIFSVRLKRAWVKVSSVSVGFEVEAQLVNGAFECFVATITGLHR